MLLNNSALLLSFILRLGQMLRHVYIGSGDAVVYTAVKTDAVRNNTVGVDNDIIYCSSLGRIFLHSIQGRYCPYVVL